MLLNLLTSRFASTDYKAFATPWASAYYKCIQEHYWEGSDKQVREDFFYRPSFPISFVRAQTFNLQNPRKLPLVLFNTCSANQVVGKQSCPLQGLSPVTMP